MTAVRDGLPEGRYGRADAAFRTDRRLKLFGAVLGVLALGAIGWGGWSYLTTNDVSAQVDTFTVPSSSRVVAHLEVHKPTDAVAVCTLRSQAADQAEVGRVSVTIPQHASAVDTTVTIRTTATGTTAELLSCQRASQAGQN